MAAELEEGGNTPISGFSAARNLESRLGEKERERRKSRRRETRESHVAVRVVTGCRNGKNKGDAGFDRKGFEREVI